MNISEGPIESDASSNSSGAYQKNKFCWQLRIWESVIVHYDKIDLEWIRGWPEAEFAYLDPLIF
jgi:hypothetical protein